MTAEKQCNIRIFLSYTDLTVFYQLSFLGQKIHKYLQN